MLFPFCRVCSQSLTTKMSENGSTQGVTYYAIASLFCQTLNTIWDMVLNKSVTVGSNELQPGVAQHRHNQFTQTKMSECSYLLADQG
jgi:hypothetical protein